MCRASSGPRGRRSPSVSTPGPGLEHRTQQATHGLMMQWTRRILAAGGEGADPRRRAPARGGTDHDRGDPGTGSRHAREVACAHMGFSPARCRRARYSRRGDDDHRDFAGHPALRGGGPVGADPVLAVGGSRCRGDAVRDSSALPALDGRLTPRHIRPGRFRTCHALRELWQLCDDNPAPRARRLGARVRGDRLEVPDELASYAGAGRATAMPRTLTTARPVAHRALSP
jgi:hypothetical protein